MTLADIGLGAVIMTVLIALVAPPLGFILGDLYGRYLNWWQKKIALKLR